MGAVSLPSVARGVSGQCVDALDVKIRNDDVANWPIHLAVGVTVEGAGSMLEYWPREQGNGEGAYYWLGVGGQKRCHPRRASCFVKA